MVVKLFWNNLATGIYGTFKVKSDSGYITDGFLKLVEIIKWFGWLKLKVDGYGKGNFGIDFSLKSDYGKDIVV